jgi:hypothetical protein
MKKKTEAAVGMITTSLAIFSMDSDNIGTALVFGIISILLIIHVSVENNKPDNLNP